MRIPFAKSVQVLIACLFGLASSGAALGATFTVGGTLSKMNSGDSILLELNGKYSTVLTANGAFHFGNPLSPGTAYAVTVKTQPKGQLCTVVKGSGTIGSANVTNVAVSCLNAYTIGGTITGLAAKDKMVLLDNGTDSLPIDLTVASSKPVPFTFHLPVATGSPYAVTVPTPPVGKVCTVAKGSGKVGSANITSVAITCTAGWTIGGTVSDLKKGQTLTLLDNKGNALSIAGATLSASVKQSFTFSDAVAKNATYSVTVGTQPGDETCSVAAGSGKATANVTNVAVTCTVNPYSVGGTITGLAKGAKLTLADNGTDTLPVLGTGSPIKFTFKDALITGEKYDATVAAQPAGQECTVAKGTGTIAKASVTTVAVTCATAYSIGGTFSGLKTGATMTLENNGKDAILVKGTATGLGGFTFPTELLNNASYDVTISTQPTGYKCTATGNAGKVAGKNVTTVAIACTSSTATYSVGGMVSGLVSGGSVTLANASDSDSVIVGANGPFSFPKKEAGGAAYNVSVNKQPTGENCGVTGSSGSVGTTNVTTIAVACTPINYSVSVTISGLTSGSVTLGNSSDSDSLTESGDGTFAFTKQEAYGSAYNIGVTTQPASETCTVGTVSIPATGTVTGAVNVPVSCSAGPTYTIGGNVTGLNTSESVILLNNKGDALTVNGTGSPQGFTFKTALANNAGYSVTVGTQPADETCGVTSGSGTVSGANVTNVAVSCTVNTYSVSINITGLTGSVTVDNTSDSDSLTETANGTYAFSKKANSGSNYDISIGTQPSGQTCTPGSVSVPASGKVTGPITVPVACTTNPTYTVSIAISGMSGGSITVANTSDSDSLTETANGTYAFAKKEATGAAYNISVTGQPTGQTCTAGATGTPASGTIGSAAITVNVACTKSSGGGGGGFWIPYEASSTQAFTVGGTISWPASGITGAVTLTNNSSDYATVPVGTTSFTFTTSLTTGTQYAVSIAADFGQPTGGTCTITSGATGVVGTTNITNVAVNCTVSTAADRATEGRSSSLAIPRQTNLARSLAKSRAYPSVIRETTAAGSTGLFIIPSDQITKSPAPTWITTDPVKIQAIGVNIVFGSSGLSSYIPKLIMYSDTDFSGNTKLYGLDISDTTKTPTPVRISSLALDSTKEICNGSQGQVNLTDPTTIFVVLDIAPTGTCNFGSSDTFEVVHYTDSSSTAPKTVSLDTGDFDELYNNGVQSGLIVFDPTASTVKVYTDETFTTSTTLWTGVNEGLSLATGVAKKGYTTETSELYYLVTTGVSESDPSGTTTLYLIDHSGAASSVFTGPVGSSVTDDNNLYFVSTTGYTSTDTSTIYQVPLGGTTHSTLYAGPSTITVTVNSAKQTENLSYELIGSNDSLLIFEESYGSIGNGTSVTTLYNVPVGTKTTTPTTIATYDNAGVEAFLGTPSSGSLSNDVLFVSIDTETVTKTGVTISWSSIAFPIGGPYTGTPLANSYYGDLGILTSNVGGDAWRVKGINDSNIGFAGGTFYLTDIGSLTDTAVTTTGGGHYSFPLLNSPTDNGYIGILLGLSNFGVAVGDFLDSGSTTETDIGVALDTTNNFLYPISLPNTNVDF